MKATAQKPALFILLLGTLTFSLSSVPGHSDGQRTMASVEVGEDTAEGNDTLPDFESKMHAKASANENFSTEVGDKERVKFKTSVKVGVKAVAHPDLMAEHPDYTEKKMLNIDLVLETDCSTCYSGRKKEEIHDATLSVEQIGDLNSHIKALIDSRAMKLAKPEMEAKAKVTAEKAKAEKVANCEIGSEDEKLSCNVERMGKEDDVEAAKIFKNLVRPGIDARLNSSNPEKRKQGKELLAQVQKHGAGGDLVRDEADALTHVAFFEDKADAIRTVMNALPANDPRRLQLSPLIEQYNLAAGGYFGNKLAYNQANPFATPDYTAMFGGDLAAYQAQLAISFQGLMAQQMASTQQIYSLAASANQANTKVGGFSPYVNPLFNAQVAGLTAQNSAAVPALANTQNQFPGAPAATAVTTLGH